MRVFLQKKHDGNLWPACEKSEKLAAAMQPGDACEVDWKSRKTRSLQWHKRYWALCTLIWQNVETIRVGEEDIAVKSAEHVHMILKLKAGLYDEMIKTSIGTAYIIKSIGFDTMSAEDWADSWKKIVDVVHADILPGIGVRELEDHIARCAT